MAKNSWFWVFDLNKIPFPIFNKWKRKCLLLGSYKIYVEATFWETNRAYVYVTDNTNCNYGVKASIQNKIL